MLAVFGGSGCQYYSWWSSTLWIIRVTCRNPDKNHLNYINKEILLNMVHPYPMLLRRGKRFPMDRHNNTWNMLENVNKLQNSILELCKKQNSNCIGNKAQIVCPSCDLFPSLEKKSLEECHSACGIYLWHQRDSSLSIFLVWFEFFYSRPMFRHYIVNKLSCNKKIIFWSLLYFVRIGPKEDFFHCLKCNLCLAMNLRGKHKVHYSVCII